MGARLVFAKFQTHDILVEQGRLFYAVVHAFISAGYHVQIYDNLEPTRLGRCGSLVPNLPGVTLTRKPCAQPNRTMYLYDTRDSELFHLPWHKKVHLCDDLFASYCLRPPLIMPYAMHPRQTPLATYEQLERLAHKRRAIRIFFSGDTEGYDRSRISYPAPKLPRLQVINTLKERLPTRTVMIGDLDACASLAEPDPRSPPRLVLMDTSRVWVEESLWLDTIASADFFLSPPGIVMPMCHNIIESMAVGTIPLTNYPEWMQPNLVHMDNCITFDSTDDLIRKVQLALTLSSDDIARMRANVVSYYRRHLDPRRFVEKLEARPNLEQTVLLYTECNAVKNSAHLGRHSVLMRNGSAQRISALISCLTRSAAYRIASTALSNRMRRIIHRLVRVLS